MLDGKEGSGHPLTNRGKCLSCVLEMCIVFLLDVLKIRLKSHLKAPNMQQKFKKKREIKQMKIINTTTLKSALTSNGPWTGSWH